MHLGMDETAVKGQNYIPPAMVPKDVLNTVVMWDSVLVSVWVPIGP